MANQKEKKDPREILGTQLRGGEKPFQEKTASSETPTEEGQQPEPTSPSDTPKSEKRPKTKRKSTTTPAKTAYKDIRDDELVPLSSQIPEPLADRFEKYLKKPGAIRPKYVALTRALEMFLDKAEEAQREYEITMSNLGI